MTKWERIRKNNHWFDALYNACAAGHLLGARLIAEPQPPPRQYGKLRDLASEKRHKRMSFIDEERRD